MTEAKYCADCKYYIDGACWHKFRFNCKHAELWTPIWYKPNKEQDSEKDT